MTDQPDNVIRLVPPSVGDAYPIDVDEMLEAWQGKLLDVAIVGTSLDGDLIVAGSGTAADSLMLLMQGTHTLVGGTLPPE